MSQRVQLPADRSEFQETSISLTFGNFAGVSSKGPGAPTGVLITEAGHARAVVQARRRIARVCNGRYRGMDGGRLARYCAESGYFICAQNLETHGSI